MRSKLDTDQLLLLASNKLQKLATIDEDLRPEPSEQLFETSFYKAGSDNAVEISGDIGFKELEVNGCNTIAETADY